jgi:DNA ligase (NAD+)
MASATERLAAVLTTARDAYYNGHPHMTDEKFDRLEGQLRLLDSNHTFFSQVGAPAPVNGWAKVKHVIPMGSQQKAQGKEDMASWHQGVVGSNQMIVMDKLDGISISLRYEGGRLVQAVTRGDGVEGEDITRNVKLMQVPLNPQIETSYIPDCWVRGEIVCRRSDFDAHFPGESNPRNTASGTSKRQSDPSKCKHLTVIAFECLNDAGNHMTKGEELVRLEQHGFTVPQYQGADDLDEVFDIYDEYLVSTRDSLDYETDGLIVRIDNNDEWTAAGEKNHRPAGSIAYKYPHDAKETTLNAIKWQVGKSGRITPVAEFDSVSLAGANVQRASLHNISNIESVASEGGHTGLRKGDLIMVSRRNDVIPYVEGLVTPKTSGALFVPPTECPCCMTALVMEGEYLVCNGTDCSAQVAGAIKRWVKKVGILQWGDTIIDHLVAEGLVDSIADIYELDDDMLSGSVMNGRKVGGMATPMLQNLHAKKELPIHVLVGSMGIDLWGRSMVKKLVDQGIDTLDAMRDATVDEIAALPQMGTTKAEAFVSGLKAREKALCDILLYITIKPPCTGPLKGMTVCMTGFRNADMHNAIEESGGTVKSSVSKGLSYLVLRDINSTSSKAKKAKSQGTQCIGIDHMWGLLGGQP